MVRTVDLDSATLETGTDLELERFRLVTRLVVDRLGDTELQRSQGRDPGHT